MKDDTLTRKLIADAEGAGEDRRLQQIATFFRESRKVEEPKTAEVVKVTRALELVELSMLKQKQIAEMNKRQALEFDSFAGEIDSEIELMYKKMETAKAELADAKIVKKNRQEYRKLVNVMNEVPTRAETARKLEEVRDELERQHDRQKVLEAKLTDRRNHLQAFNVILSNFQRFCTEDDDDDETGISNNGDNDDDDSASVSEKQEDEK
ncbi:Protein CBG22401 [Caenorhabditis briggsae]|uniref:Uncharacterized protein n=2 Tax=Caenorhabditis briggsae TaxID=6238 RepID=A0AAE9D313_CAEBR|nr:Protein CBG22401 [Caenorhabditis briggsae]ULT93656.1 hypothetical protein L3Y34_003271 [Caenorhabditis briggsae]CAP38996.1 Protein CBG22401 [Caenorhabditis briggsae]